MFCSVILPVNRYLSWHFSTKDRKLHIIFLFERILQDRLESTLSNYIDNLNYNGSQSSFDRWRRPLCLWANVLPDCSMEKIHDKAQLLLERWMIIIVLVLCSASFVPLQPISRSVCCCFAQKTRNFPCSWHAWWDCSTPWPWSEDWSLLRLSSSSLPFVVLLKVSALIWSR